MSSGPLLIPIKGALQLITPKNQTPTHPTPDLFVFQYNPDQITRNLSYQDPANPQTILPTPNEIINLTIELDAADNLEKPQQNPIAAENGLHPQLATIQAMMQAQQQTSSTQETPTVIFHWGKNRIIPVKITNLTVTETAFQPKLNPIQTQINLTMRILQLTELKKNTEAYQICINAQNQKDKMIILYKKTLDQSTLDFYGVKPTNPGPGIGMGASPIPTSPTKPQKPKTA